MSARRAPVAGIEEPRARSLGERGAARPVLACSAAAAAAAALTARGFDPAVAPLAAVASAKAHLSTFLTAVVAPVAVVAAVVAGPTRQARLFAVATVAVLAFETTRGAALLPPAHGGALRAALAVAGALAFAGPLWRGEARGLALGMGGVAVALPASHAGAALALASTTVPSANGALATAVAFGAAACAHAAARGAAARAA
ncbi:MAG: hypothetical protein ACFB00_01870, partial [Parvularculaceae bacterium]